MSKEFKTFSDLINDEVFIQMVDKQLTELIRKRVLRSPARPGYKYRKDWYDELSKDGNLNKEFIIKHFEKAELKKSPLNSKQRRLVIFICRNAFNKTLDFYKREQILLDS